MNKLIVLSIALFVSVTANAQIPNKCVTSRAAVASAQKNLLMEKDKLSKLEASVAAQTDRDMKRASTLLARSQFAEAAAQGSVAEATRLGLSCAILPQPCLTDAETEARTEVIRNQGRAASRKKAYTLWLTRMKQRSENAAKRATLQRARVARATTTLAEKEADLQRCLAL